jgi:hypothetical protein
MPGMLSEIAGIDMAVAGYMKLERFRSMSIGMDDVWRVAMPGEASRENMGSAARAREVAMRIGTTSMREGERGKEGKREKELVWFCNSGCKE